MNHKKAIVVSGYSRGGTNIVWNILQSHPEICSARYETGTIFRKTNALKFSLFVSFCEKTGLLNHFLCQRIIKYRLYRLKYSNFKHRFNRYKLEDQAYTRKEVSDSIICFKSVNMDIEYTRLLLDLYPDLYFIGLTRNGYALAEGHYRRGSTAASTGRLYQTIADQFQHYSKSLKNFTLIRFEDVLHRPFDVASELFEFINVHPVKLGKLRVKSKKIVGNEGSRISSFKKEKQKYWFDASEIQQIFDTDINDRQIRQLSRDMIIDFNQEAASALEYFGYDVIQP